MSERIAELEARLRELELERKIAELELEIARLRATQPAPYCPTPWPCEPWYPTYPWITWRDGSGTQWHSAARFRLVGTPEPEAAS